jgi:inorganic pyrophosphatase/exopolyphosphatase
MLFMVTDILKLHTEVLVIGEEELEFVREAYKGKLLSEDHMDILSIGRLVSRKKQFIPFADEYLTKRLLTLSTNNNDQHHLKNHPR